MSAAGSESDSENEENERKNARKSKRAVSVKLRTTRPPSGRSEASNSDEKALEQSIVLSQVQTKEMQQSKQVLALLQSKPIAKRSKVQDAKSIFMKGRDKGLREDKAGLAAYSAKAAGDSITQAHAQAEARENDARVPSSDQWGGGDQIQNRDALSLSSSPPSPSQSSQQSVEDDAAAAAREAREAERKLKEEAAARQAELEAAERAAAASAEAKAGAIATAKDAYHEAEAMLSANDLASAREHHARGVEALTAVGCIKCEEFAMLGQTLQRITDTAKVWEDALVGAEAAVSQAQESLAGRDLQGARASFDRAQGSYSLANPEQAAASMSAVSINLRVCRTRQKCIGRRTSYAPDASVPQAPSALNAARMRGAVRPTAN